MSQNNTGAEPDADGWVSGENRAADLAVIYESLDPSVRRRIALIRRGDTGRWAIPGGFVDPGEDPMMTMLREFQEEAGVDLGYFSAPVTLVKSGIPVGDPRDIPGERWITTTLGVMVIDELPALDGGDDAVDARWVDFASAEQLVRLLGASGFGGVYEPHVKLLVLVEQELALLDRIGVYYDRNIAFGLLKTGVPKAEVLRQRRRYVRDARRSPSAVHAITSTAD